MRLSRFTNKKAASNGAPSRKARWLSQGRKSEPTGHFEHARTTNVPVCRQSMVGVIGFEYTPPQPFQLLAGLGWQPKDRNGSQWNNYWTWIGHSKVCGYNAPFQARSDYIRTDLRIMSLADDSENKENKASHSADSGKVSQNPHYPRTKETDTPCSKEPPPDGDS
jgi:hypothetical protein